MHGLLNQEFTKKLEDNIALSPVLRFDEEFKTLMRQLITEVHELNNSLKNNDRGI